jgi:hypothetical protein
VADARLFAFSPHHRLLLELRAFDAGMVPSSSVLPSHVGLCGAAALGSYHAAGGANVKACRRHQREDWRVAGGIESATDN